LQKFDLESLSKNEFVILSSRKFENSIVSSIQDFKIKEIKTTNEILAIKDYYPFTTIQSFKGMESNYVLITDIVDLTSDTAKSILYIGMSRARYGIVLLISESSKNQYRELLKRKLN
jgi:hypothetical protein